MTCPEARLQCSVVACCDVGPCAVGSAMERRAIREPLFRIVPPEFLTLPAGVNRATLTTAGSCIVHVIPIAVPDDITYLSDCWEGAATDGESALYVSDSSRIALEFPDVSAPYALAFEALD